MNSMHADYQEQLRLRAVSYAVSHAQDKDKEKEKEKERTLQQELDEARAGMHQLAEEAFARQKQLREIQATRELMAKENVQLQQQVEGERRERAAAQQRAMAAQSRVTNLELELANLEQRNEQVQFHLHREIADLRELAGASDVKQRMAALEAENAQLQGVLASQMADTQTRLKMSDDIMQSAHKSLEETRAQLRRSQASLEIEKMSGAALAAQLAALRERYFVHENTAECH